MKYLKITPLSVPVLRKNTAVCTQLTPQSQKGEVVASRNRDPNTGEEETIHLFLAKGTIRMLCFGPENNQTRATGS